MFQVKPAVREATPALIGLWGPSGGGKTFSALLMARGLVGPKGKIVVIDTENGRAKFYAKLVGGWQHIDFQPPYTPARYTEAMDAAEKAGADVIIIDSMSHVWEGEGGTLDMADASDLKGLAKWKAPKTQYKRMMNNLLRSRVNVIFCLRAKEKYVQHGAGKDAQIIAQGLVPIMDKHFIYEMTVAAQLSPLNHSPVAPIKVPDDLSDAVKVGQLLSEDTGKKIAAWVAGGAAVDQDAQDLKRAARDKATHGSVAMRDWWMTLTKPQRSTLGSIVEELQMTARQADDDMASASRDGGEQEADRDPLDDAFTAPKDKAPA